MFFESSAPSLCGFAGESIHAPSICQVSTKYMYLARQEGISVAAIGLALGGVAWHSGTQEVHFSTEVGSRTELLLAIGYRELVCLYFKTFPPFNLVFWGQLDGYGMPQSRKDRASVSQLWNDVVFHARHG